ncbi:hypothetical protein BC826DRAFT_1022905 [Russula brevipes]|nr:hypothetical protein BC826DRAFT_1022905 [Russula brevipes]
MTIITFYEETEASCERTGPAQLACSSRSSTKARRREALPSLLFCHGPSMHSISDETTPLAHGTDSPSDAASISLTLPRHLRPPSEHPHNLASPQWVPLPMLQPRLMRPCQLVAFHRLLLPKTNKGLNPAATFAHRRRHSGPFTADVQHMYTRV